MPDSLSVQARQTPKLVASEPGFFVAWLAEESCVPELSVYVSPLMRASDELFQEVINTLSGYFIEAEYIETVKDKDMMFGKGVLIKISMYKDLLTRHPGSSYQADKRAIHMHKIQDAMNGGVHRAESYQLPTQRCHFSS
jgi:hypothetical protein